MTRKAHENNRHNFTPAAEVVGGLEPSIPTNCVPWFFSSLSLPMEIPVLWVRLVLISRQLTLNPSEGEDGKAVRKGQKPRTATGQTTGADK